MSEKVILVIYGRGGHQEQMRRLLIQLRKASPDMKFVSIADVPDKLGSLKHLECPEPRDKFAKWGSPFKLCYAASVSLVQCFRLTKQFNISGIVSTGPGMAVLPSIFFRLLGKHVVYIESWSRFFTGSLTGHVMYRVSHSFYVQNRSMSKVFPKAEYAGRL
ncbi:PssD/Cps14F family polysaccharide biosynthesis glycosyltransferase [Shewanella sp. UCD-KL12]|uniref:PssD/Cps14F family polysaccharide biosynthesis glycosyltransferase n=1 Tax=Shewanella sp. UCD-KL12 TaxID=1917163 RepID=UPI000970B7EA|nr:PssD/Cps14F family polysaccharide biosynthesis glycosyltransferase [Shewanella sp. UCD-KL12]